MYYMVPNKEEGIIFHTKQFLRNFSSCINSNFNGNMSRFVICEILTREECVIRFLRAHKSAGCRNCLSSLYAA
jgi:hypothetical protein